MSQPSDRSSTFGFPTRLTSIEKFHFYDDCYEFPNNLFCRLRFEGKIDREKAIEAIRFFEERHPLVTAVVEVNGNDLQWIQGSGPSETLDWRDQIEAPAFPGLDITERAGVQLLFMATDTECEIWVHAHHTALDGGAGIQIANEWMMAYGNLVNFRPVDKGISGVDKSQLEHRSKLGLFTKGFLQQAFKQPIALLGASKFLFRKFGLLTNAIFERSKPVVLHDTFPVIHGDWLSPETTLSLKHQSIRHKVSLNAVLMTHLFLTVNEWRTKHQHGRPEDWLRVLMPMSIRGMSDRRMPACNRSSVVQIDRRPKDFKRPDLMAKGLDFEIGLIRQWQLNKSFLIVIRMMSMIPRWIKSSAQNRKFRGTIIFTNLGHPFSKNKRLRSKSGIYAGQMKLKYFDWVGPIRPGIGVNFSVQQHDDQIRLSMHVDTRQVDLADAKELFDAYVERMNEVRI